MANRDVTYCNGKGCAERDEGQYYWMDHCNVEIREGYVQTTE